jgi:hypothetical protein
VAAAGLSCLHAQDAVPVAVVTRAAWDFAELAPVTLFVVTDTNLIRRVVPAVSAAFEVAALAVVARVTQAEARIHRLLRTMVTGQLARGTHPAGNTTAARVGGAHAVNTARRKFRFVAKPSGVTVGGAGAIRNVASRAAPAVIASAGMGGPVARTVARTVDSRFSRCRSDRRTSRNLTDRPTPINFAEAHCGASVLHSVAVP